MSKGWDNTMLKKLKALTVKGLSTSEIGKRLGMSKNAVVGKLNRLGWNSKAGGIPAKDSAKKDINKKLVSKKASSDKGTKKLIKIENTRVKKQDGKNIKTSAKITKRGSVIKDTKASLNKNLAIHQRIIQHSLEMANLKSNQCRWPIGDPDSEDFHFCAEPVFVGKPYCYEHCKQAYQFTPPKKK